MRTKFSNEKAKALLQPFDGVNPSVSRILRGAREDWNGDIGCALDDARDGNYGTAPAKFARALPETFAHVAVTDSDAAAEDEAEAAAQAEYEARKLAEKMDAERLVRDVGEAEKAGRVRVSMKTEDGGPSSYSWDTGAAAFTPEGKVFARRTALRDGGTWYWSK